MMRRITPLLLVFAGFVAVPARADIPEILACADQADPKARLACFDAAVVKLKADVAEEQTRKRSLFGFAFPLIGSDNDSDKAREPDLGPKEVTQITAKLSGSIKDGFGHVIMTLDNGQTWKVQDQTLVPLGAARANGVIISRNLMGGYYLSVVGQNNEISVTRIR
jgi:hypothetical protein